MSAALWQFSASDLLVLFVQTVESQALGGRSIRKPSAFGQPAQQKEQLALQVPDGLNWPLCAFWHLAFPG